MPNWESVEEKSHTIVVHTQRALLELQHERLPMVLMNAQTEMKHGGREESVFPATDWGLAKP